MENVPKIVLVFIIIIILISYLFYIIVLVFFSNGKNKFKNLAINDQINISVTIFWSK